MTNKMILNSKEAAEFLGISTPHLYELNKEGKLPVKYIGSKPMYFVDELIDWVKAGKSADADKKSHVFTCN